MIKSWGELYNNIKEKKYNDKDQVLIDGYISYLKEVCMMVDIEEIRLEKKSLNSLYYLMNLIKKIINGSSHDDYSYDLYSTKRAFSYNAIGQYYSIKNKKSNKSAWLWFGIDFEDEPTISIWMDEDWNFFFDKMRKSSGNDITFDKDNYAIYIGLSNDKFDIFNKSNKENQEMILRNFFKDTNKIIEEYLI